jgi:hypothetical protein
MEGVHFEKKQLVAQWKSSLAAIQRCRGRLVSAGLRAGTPHLSATHHTQRSAPHSAAPGDVTLHRTNGHDNTFGPLPLPLAWVSQA